MFTLFYCDSSTFLNDNILEMLVFFKFISEKLFSELKKDISLHISSNSLNFDMLLIYFSFSTHIPYGSKIWKIISFEENVEK